MKQKCWHPWKGIDIRNSNVKYHSFNHHYSENISKVKVQIEFQNERRDKKICPLILDRRGIKNRYRQKKNNNRSFIFQSFIENVIAHVFVLIKYSTT